jgi:hypothetical protein
MKSMQTLSNLPQLPCVYALTGGRGGSKYIAYVGIAEKLRTRITQHLVRRDSSVATGTTAAVLNPDYVTEVRWWHIPDFADKSTREAAEILALSILDPALRSRGNATEAAKEKAEDEQFLSQMSDFFADEPTGSLEIITLQDAIAKLGELEKRIEELESGRSDG